MRTLGKSQVCAWFIILLGFFALFKAFLSTGFLQRQFGNGFAPNRKHIFTQRPENLTVRGLVFYGRKDRAEILHCYLERNLVDRGGWLQEVVWVLNTNVSDDITYLQQLLNSQPRYRLQSVERNSLGEGFRHGYDKLVPSSLYIKIDDDVVWIADDTIPRLVLAKLNHPEHLIVSANVINSPLMGKIHGDRGAHRPYLPALFQNTSDIATSWDYTRYPQWQGPSDYSLRWEEQVDPHIPWLPSSDIASTPLIGIEYDSWGNGLTDWKLGYQAALSLLQNIRGNTLVDYWKGFEEFHFTHGLQLSINFFAMLSDDILAHLPMDATDDEYWLTVSLPAKLSKHIVVENRALAAHLSFKYQYHIDQTDALARFTDYARYIGC